ncbi:penicillin-binding transpeptidase domain-containing protein [Brachybacterium timonense]|uniref:penicillin-binding transpeptidase domain-containing protein n=1 Tax=Brachybacterium timonense TaxID=2050896 RepID=UPI000D0B085D|nr:penicillin-binding transpeptidase domain-containing protein [Brachybacterium timonense]
MTRRPGRHRSRTGTSETSARPTHPRRPSRRAVLGSGALLAAAGAGTGISWYRHKKGDASSETASLLTALRAGDLDGAPLDASERHSAAERFAATVGALRETLGEPTIELTRQEGGADQLSLHLAWSWGLGRGQAPWTYTTVVTLARGDEGWVTTLPIEALVPGAKEGDRLEVRTVQPAMGRILDARGLQVYGPTAVIDVGIDKGSLQHGDVGDSAVDLARVLGIDPDAFRARVEASGPKAFVTALRIREESAGDYNLDAADDVPGCLQQDAVAALAVEKGFAPGVLGSLREATAEDIEDSDGQLAAGDLVGSGGICAAFGTTLLGTPGRTITRVPARGSSSEELHRLPVVDGEDVLITLDSGLQRMATSVLADAEAPSSICVVRPSDGGLLAAALGPTGQEYPIGLVGQYAPGSTFKTITALSMLRLGDTPDTVVECPAKATIEGRSFKNADRMDPAHFGPMPLKDAIAHSCNTALLLEHDRVSQELLADSAASLGIGLKAGVGLDCFMGSVDPADTGTEHVAAMMGQGRVLASPLVMADVMASVMAGRTVTPQILINPTEPADEPGSPLTREEAECLRGMLRGVVTYGGLSSLFGDYPGAPVHAKTGTAQWVDGGEIRLHSWVIVGQGDLAFSVFVETGDYGSRTAAPLAKRFLDAVHSE